MGANQYAEIRQWESRWHKSPDAQIVGISQSGSSVVAVGWFGYVNLDLKEGESVRACVSQTRAFADALERTLEEYEKWDTTSSSSDAAPQVSSPRTLRPRTRGSKTSGS